MEWKESFNIGIDVIDHQHRQILQYINTLEEIRVSGQRDKIQEVLEDLIDYTQSHFSFEENLLAQVNYQYLPSHKGIHDLFVKRLNEYRQRFEKGEAVENDLYRLLSKWLINHIQHDDQDYVDAVRDNMIRYLRSQEQKKEKSWFARLFD
ncbi:MULTISPECIES: bacteriohemerythrin [Acinetobacter]|uniref:Bacteriohemerythrin n=2 Tax=Acinetobacter TaxID=469 RepID=A0ABT7WRT1_9GAMM|nr:MULTISPECIES: bacteriohemerythrin [Acinetobacter]MCY6413267.1 bacteriohemerythrin [Acinetobacter thutiue]MDH0032603.1 bacteriohemerythrin [Acinetobacter sp. GD04021]MDH0886911.1 bacteriohemerythrin [Acinetobacter sp. GD03873]MDH1083276.1 bacteriohemerythrin [Acinetobacter sp. GD03983]MDH2190227.1 bacteriohemerythrin [Acinetobacter sp. GD03645]